LFLSYQSSTGTHRIIAEAFDLIQSISARFWQMWDSTDLDR
jgi:hypothetical protein